MASHATQGGGCSIAVIFGHCASCVVEVQVFHKSFRSPAPRCWSPCLFATAEDPGAHRVGLNTGEKRIFEKCEQNTAFLVQ